MTSAVFLLLCGTHFTASAPILDQSFVPRTLNRFNGVGPGGFIAQTFTVGITGVLTDVDVLVERNGFADLRFDIRSTVNGVPIANEALALASITVPASTIPFPVSFLDFDISAFNMHISQGDVLAIVLSDNARWFADDDLYPGGAAYSRGSPDSAFAPILPAGFQDVGFQTFVEPISAPEPSALILISTSMIGLICFRILSVCRGGSAVVIKMLCLWLWAASAAKAA